MEQLKKTCPECGSPLKVHHEPQTQEYPGACVWPGSTMIICSNPECFYDEDVKTDPIDEDQIRETPFFDYRGYDEPEYD